MIGLAALAILIFWGFVSYKTSSFLVKKIKQEIIKYGLQTVICGLLFVAPVADDIAGGFQFRALCRQNTAVVDEEKVRGKSVFLADIPDEAIDNYIIPIRKKHWEFQDVVSREILISWNDYYAEGGWLSHFIGFPDGKPPYTFDGSCHAKNGINFDFKRLNIKIIARDKL